MKTRTLVSDRFKHCGQKVWESVQKVLLNYSRIIIAFLFTHSLFLSLSPIAFYLRLHNLCFDLIQWFSTLLSSKHTKYTWFFCKKGSKIDKLTTKSLYWPHKSCKVKAKKFADHLEGAHGTTCVPRHTGQETLI